MHKGPGILSPAQYGTSVKHTSPAPQTFLAAHLRLYSFCKPLRQSFSVQGFQRRHLLSSVYTSELRAKQEQAFSVKLRWGRRSSILKRKKQTQRVHVALLQASCKANTSLHSSNQPLCTAFYLLDLLSLPSGEEVCGKWVHW